MKTTLHCTKNNRVLPRKSLCPPLFFSPRERGKFKTKENYTLTTAENNRLIEMCRRTISGLLLELAGAPLPP